MKLAILGTDAELLYLAGAARALGHEFAWLGDVRPTEAEEIVRLAPGVRDKSTEWELLLDGNVDAVLVGQGTVGPDLRAEQLKRFVTERVPLLVVHPLFESVLPYYEVDMVRRETGGIVRHYNPMAGHPVLIELAGWVARGDSSLGPIHQVTCERGLADLSRANAIKSLVRDIELLTAVAGDIRRVTAIGPKTADASFGSMQVQMSSIGSASLRWAVRTSRTAATDCKLSLVGELGTATLRVREKPGESPAEWELEIESEDGCHTEPDGCHTEPLELYDASTAAVMSLEKAIVQSHTSRREKQSTWDVATRAMEVVDAIELSLEKGRSLDVYQQQLTEQLAFRGTMAALGCGLLLVGFLVIVVVTLLGGAEGAVGHRLLPAWPVALLAVLSFFLLLQLVPLLLHRSKRQRSSSSSDQSPD